MLERTEVDWWLCMFDFELYCDDSGTDGTSPIAVATCYVASKAQWDQFVRNWNDVQRDEEFECFHMTEFVAKPDAGHKPFCDWGIDKKTRVYAKLSSIINTRARKGFGIAVPKADFDAAAPRHFRDLYANDHYTYAVMCCIGMIAEWRSQYDIVPPIQYIFDQGSPTDQISAVWKRLSQDPEYALKYGLAPNGYGFQDKNFFKPLQAADILAWQMRNQMKRLRDKYKSLSDFSPEDEARLRHPGFQQLLKIPMQLGFFTEHQMRKVFDDTAEYERTHGKPAYPSLYIPKLI